MDISGVTSTAGAVATAKDSASRASLGGTFDDFLTLLTTQMQYQDPLDPQDSSEWTNQLVQFSQVEQQISTNDKLEGLAAVQVNGQLSAAISMIGLDTEVYGDAFTLESGKPVPLTYTLPQEADSATLIVKAADGTVVKSASVQTAQGTHSFTFDGKTVDGDNLPSGDYKIELAAFDAEGNHIKDVPTTVTGRVSGVESANGGMVLRMGNVAIPIENVLSAKTGG